MITETFDNPSILSLRFSRTPGFLAVIFRGPLCIKFDDNFLSNISHFLITNAAKRTYEFFLAKQVAPKIHENIH